MKRQYVINPPSTFMPEFLYKWNVSAWKKLIEWSKKEFQARLVYLSEHGYWKELKYMNENSSAIYILAELHGFRKMCAIMDEYVWNSLTMRERSFIRKSFELRDLIMR